MFLCGWKSKWLLRKRLGCVLREHGDHDPIHDFYLRLVEGCNFNEDILGVQTDLGVISIDDGGKRANGSVGVEDGRVNSGVADNVKILAQVPVLLFRVLALDFSGLQ